MDPLKMPMDGSLFFQIQTKARVQRPPRRPKSVPVWDSSGGRRRRLVPERLPPSTGVQQRPGPPSRRSAQCLKEKLASNMPGLNSENSIPKTRVLVARISSKLIELQYLILVTLCFFEQSEKWDFCRIVLSFLELLSIYQFNNLKKVSRSRN